MQKGKKQILFATGESLASHAGVFRGARTSSLPTNRRDEIRAPLKMPSREAIFQPFKF